MNGFEQRVKEIAFSNKTWDVRPSKESTGTVT